MPFQSLLPPDSKEHSHHHANAKLNVLSSTITPGKRGCTNCPLDKVHGVHKIFGKVRGRDIFIWAQSPGAKENKERKELIGPSGKWLWHELKRVNITRDKCDIQNTVRCWPVDIKTGVWPPFKMRPPAKAEIKCCSLYNEKALEKSKAKLHLVFGQVAAASLLKNEYRKDQRIFYSDNLKSWVVVLDHPSFFIRQGYTAGDGKAANASLQRFRSDLDKAKQLLKKDKFDRYEYVKSQNYIGVTSSEQSRIVYRKLKKKAAQGYRLVADMEEGWVNEKGEADESGEYVALCCGFSYKPGTAYTFALRHPGTGISERCYKYNLRNVQRLCNDPKVKLGFHFGISDTNAIRKLLKTEVKGYDYDTLLASYFKDPNAKKYGLAAVAERHYPDYLDYKGLEGPSAFTPAFIELLKDKKYKKLTSIPQQVRFARTRNGMLNLARMPWKTMVLYNGADCDLEKRIEEDTKKFVNPPLMQVYIDAAYILHRMETDKRCMPLFDYSWHPKLAKMFGLRKKKLEKQVKKMAGKYAYIPTKADRPAWLSYINKDGPCPPVRKLKFKPGSNDHILWLLFVKLKYRFVSVKGKKPNTQAGTLESLGLKHKKANIIVAYRQTGKAIGTYIEGFFKCANLNGGHLRTNWKMTGTSTGRMSSGKTSDKKNDSVINFQNIHGDELIQCLLITDRLWKNLYNYWREFGDFTRKSWKKFKDVYVDLGFDFSQNELRQLAEESNDKNLIKMFSSGKDPHVEVGHEITGWAKEKIAHDARIRRLIKAMQFGLVFGLQGEGLYRDITRQGVKTTLHEVNKFHRNYFKKFAGVKRLLESYRKFVKEHKYVENVFGFRRPLDTDESDDSGEKKHGAYWGNQAINTPIQGASHQLLMMAIAALYRYPKKYKLLKYPNKEIHDALYFRVKLKYLFQAIKDGLSLMLKEPVKIVEEDFGLEKKVPLSAKPKAGFRFGVEIELEENNISNEWEFLNEWCKANKKLEHNYKKQLQELTN